MFGLLNWKLDIMRGRMQEDHMELVDELKSVKDQLEKAKSEIVVKVGDLEAAVVASGTPSVEVTNAVAELKAVAQGLDDVVADVVADVAEAEVVAEAPAEAPAEVVAEAPAEVVSDVAEVPVEAPVEVPVEAEAPAEVPEEVPVSPSE
jgi:hypothetical protein